jgi:hypothetical protein
LGADLLVTPMDKPAGADSHGNADGEQHHPAEDAERQGANGEGEQHAGSVHPPRGLNREGTAEGNFHGRSGSLGTKDLCSAATRRSAKSPYRATDPNCLNITKRRIVTTTAS